MWSTNIFRCWKWSLQILINNRIYRKCSVLVYSVEEVACKNFTLGFFLFRPVCGIRGKTLIINLPGSKKGSQVRSILTDLLLRTHDESLPLFWVVASTHYNKFCKNELICVFVYLNAPSLSVRDNTIRVWWKVLCDQDSAACRAGQRSLWPAVVSSSFSGQTVPDPCVVYSLQENVLFHTELRRGPSIW